MAKKKDAVETASEQLHLRVTPTWLEHLRKRSGQLNMSMTDIVLEALSDYLGAPKGAKRRI